MFFSQRWMHEENKRHFEKIEHRIEGLENLLHGNGKDGLIVVVDRIRQTQKFHQKITFVILVAVVGTAINSLWPIAVKLLTLTQK